MPRRWYSATLAYCTVACSREPRRRGRRGSWRGARRRAMVNRRHSSGAHHCHTRWRLVVVAVPAQRLPEQLRPPSSWAGVADRRPAVRAPRSWPLAGGAAAAPVAGAVHRPEARARSGSRTPAGCRPRCSGTPLPPVDPGPDQVEGVGGVDPGAGRALGGAPVAAADVQHPERAVGPTRTSRGPHRWPVRRCGERAAQPDRSGAVPDPGGGLGPGVEVPRHQPGGDLPLHLRAEPGQVQPGLLPEPRERGQGRTPDSTGPNPSRHPIHRRRRRLGCEADEEREACERCTRARLRRATSTGSVSASCAGVGMERGRARGGSEVLDDRGGVCGGDLAKQRVGPEVGPDPVRTRSRGIGVPLQQPECASRLHRRGHPREMVGHGAIARTNGGRLSVSHQRRHGSEIPSSNQTT